MIPVPEEVIETLSSYIQAKCGRAERSWMRAKEEEDSITGDFFGNLSTEGGVVGDYSWGFYYNKFRGRGKNALEKIVGADGIITIHYTDPPENIEYYKSLAYQAKKVGGRIEEDQLQKMRRYFPGGNMVVIYGPDGYTAYENNPSVALRLCDLITNNFLACNIGIEGLYYDDNAKRLILPAATPATGVIGERFLVEIEKAVPRRRRK
jgi:hypothetical protein